MMRTKKFRDGVEERFKKKKKGKKKSIAKL